MIRVLGWPAFRTRDENPYNALLYGALHGDACEVHEFSVRRLLTGAYDVWHIHWPERYFALPSAVKIVLKSLLVIVFVQLARLRRTAVVWTIHNLQAHERRHPRFASWFWRAFVSRVDAAISLSRTAHTRAVATFPHLARVHHAVTPMGDFRDAYPQPVSRVDARRALGIDPDTFVYLCVGRIRPYKNIESLLAAFGPLDGDVRLVIAGHPADRQLADSIQRGADADARIGFLPRHVPAAEMPRLLAAADLVVLPYTDILNSGAALLALSFGRPVLLPDHGSVPELASEFTSDWVRTYSSALTTSVLGDAASWVRRTSRDALPAALARLNWRDIGAATLDTYRAAIAGRSGGRAQ